MEIVSFGMDSLALFSHIPMVYEGKMCSKSVFMNDGTKFMKIRSLISILIKKLFQKKTLFHLFTFKRTTNFVRFSALKYKKTH